MTATKTAFFITPIGEEGSVVRKRTDDVGKYILVPPLKERGFDLVRIDQEPTPGMVTSKIVRQIAKDSDLIIADTTGSNGNVLYELGIAHSFGRPVIHLADSASDLPFDIHNVTHIVIDDDGMIGAAAADKASVDFAATLDIVLADGFTPESPLSAASLVAQLSTSEDPSAQLIIDLYARLDGLANLVERANAVNQDLVTQNHGARSAEEQRWRQLNVDRSRSWRAAAEGEWISIRSPLGTVLSYRIEDLEQNLDSPGRFRNLLAQGF